MGKLPRKDVSIAFFNIGEDGEIVVNNLSIDESGYMEEGLPIEFFNEDIFESMDIGAHPNDE